MVARSPQAKLVFGRDNLGCKLSSAVCQRTRWEKSSSVYSGTEINSYALCLYARSGSWTFKSWLPQIRRQEN